MFPRSTTPPSHGASVTRRQFTKAALAGLAAPAVISATALGTDRRAAASERITLGCIGLGGQGFYNLQAFLSHPDVQVVAVCDVHRNHYRDNPWGTGDAGGREPAKKYVEDHYAEHVPSGTYRGCQTYVDFRQLCAREDIDAVMIATPDHWHAHCSLEALRNGKDVYCEKPVTHFFREGQLIYREVQQRDAVFQTGTQQRSGSVFRRAAELVLNGHIGAVQRVEVGLPPGYEKPMGDANETAPPEHLDYDLWCGPSEKLPYMRARHHRWWRGHLAFGGGVLMDWIGHHNDIAHWGLGVDLGGPVEVEAVGWTYPETDVYNTPFHYEIRCKFAGGTISSISDRHAMGTKFIGEDGWIMVDRPGLKASNPQWTEQDFDTGPTKVAHSTNHQRNFVDCVKSRKPCVAPAEIAHRSITPGHLGYVSHAVGRAIQWNPEREVIVGDAGAMDLLEVRYREPWKLA